MTVRASHRYTYNVRTKRRNRSRLAHLRHVRAAFCCRTPVLRSQKTLRFDLLPHMCGRNKQISSRWGSVRGVSLLHTPPHRRNKTGTADSCVSLSPANACFEARLCFAVVWSYLAFFLSGPVGWNMGKGRHDSIRPLGSV